MCCYGSSLVSIVAFKTLTQGSDTLEVWWDL